MAYHVFQCIRNYCFQGPVLIMNEIVDYLEKNPDVLCIQDLNCCKFSCSKFF